VTEIGRPEPEPPEERVLAPGAVVIDSGNNYLQQRDGRIEAIEAVVLSEAVAGERGTPAARATIHV
jgi:hypothetical protein